jgi:cellulose synthase/poly-beta-1,6-N-acetylglucosamine synthase-like glycosyltransferase
MLPMLLFTIGILLVLAGLWPFGPYQLSLLAARRICRFSPLQNPPAADASPADYGFAICLCVYNEASVIAEKIADLLILREAAGGNLEILIYVDAATDTTTEILERYRDRIRLVVSSERRGKTHGMNLLVAQTRASIVMFTDANVRIDPTAVAVLRRYFADPSIGCVCSHLSYVNASQSATAAVGSAFWSFNEWSKGLETATGSIIGADGSLFAIRRELHRPVPKGLFDDLFVSLGVLLKGYRVIRAPELRAFETHSTQVTDEFRRKARIACECMHVHFELWPELRRVGLWNLYKYIGHRLLRWIGGYLLVLGVALLVIAAMLVLGPPIVLAAGGLLLISFIAALQARLGFAMKLANVFLAFAGNAIGTWRAVRGERAITWEPPASAREVGFDRQKAGP